MASVENLGLHEIILPSVAGYPLEGRFLGAGKDANAYECGPDLVYRVTKPYKGGDPRFEPYFTDHARREVAAHSDLPDEVQVARTLMAWVSDLRVHKIIERAEGEQLLPEIEGNWVEMSFLKKEWAKSVASVAKIPEAHYERLVEDDAELRKRKIYIDYLGTGNLFYSPDIGFTIIDAEFEPQFPAKGKGLYLALIGANYLEPIMSGTKTWQDVISEESRSDVIDIIEKLYEAGHAPNYQLLFKMTCDWLNYTPPSVHSISA